MNISLPLKTCPIVTIGKKVCSSQVIRHSQTFKDLYTHCQQLHSVIYTVCSTVGGHWGPKKHVRFSPKNIAEYQIVSNFAMPNHLANEVVTFKMWKNQIVSTTVGTTFIFYDISLTYSAAPHHISLLGLSFASEMYIKHNNACNMVNLVRARISYFQFCSSIPMLDRFSDNLYIINVSLFHRVVSLFQF